MQTTRLARRRTGRSALFATLLVAAFTIVTALPASAATVSSFSPQSGPVGTVVTISGHGFQGAQNVFFGNQPVAAGGFTVNSNVSITATVPNNASTGKIKVVAADNSDAVSTDDFVVTSSASATISSFSPTCGPVGTSVRVNGTNFDGATAVKFSGTTASYTVNSSLRITATVPTGAPLGAGKISVTGADNVTVNSAADFTVTGNLSASIASFTPPSGPVGTSVQITGSNFCGASAVTFNTTDAIDFTVDSSTQITARVPTGATTGRIKVSTPVNTATSATDFTVTNPAAPTITSFTPTYGLAGTTVTINGSHFTGATTVIVGTKADPGFTVDSDTKITATVQPGSHSGPVTVVTPSGTATSATDFTVGSAPMPQIASFAPTSGPVGTNVTLTGTGFTGVTSVTFNGVADPTYRVVSDTQITAKVPTGATTGPIEVTGPGGTGTSATDFTVTSPFVESFDPMKGPWGTQVILTGGNLSNATSVKFGGTTATFVANTNTQITATVPNGAVTGPISVTTPAGTGESADDFLIQHLRSVSLSLSGSLTASGAITVADGTSACAQLAPIKVQRRTSDGWKTVGTGSTTGAGTYSIGISNQGTKFRAIALRMELGSGDVCVRAVSPTTYR